MLNGRYETSWNPAAVEFREFLKVSNKEVVPPDLEVHLVLGNYRTHKITMIHDWLSMPPHFTPTSAPWINQLECWFANLTEWRTLRWTDRSTRVLEAAIAENLAMHNESPKLIVWTNSADQILKSIENYC